MKPIIEYLISKENKKKISFGNIKDFLRTGDLGLLSNDKLLVYYTIDDLEKAIDYWNISINELHDCKSSIKKEKSMENKGIWVYLESFVNSSPIGLFTIPGSYYDENLTSTKTSSVYINMIAVNNDGPQEWIKCNYEEKLYHENVDNEFENRLKKNLVESPEKAILLYK